MTQQRGAAPDPIGDFQRWLVRSGARGVGREVGGHIAGLLGIGGKSGDVWETATTPPPEEAPECAWCPVCRAARLLRESGPGLASHVASASDAVAAIVQEATAVVESVLAGAKRPAGGRAEPTGTGWPGETGSQPGAAAAPPWDEEWDAGQASAWDQAVQEDQVAHPNGHGPGGGTATAGPPSSPSPE